MKNVLFAVLAALALALVLPSAHADEAPLAQTSAVESLPGESASATVGKFVGIAFVSPLTLVKKVAPAALDGVKSVAGDFKDGFMKGMRPDEAEPADAPTAATPPVAKTPQANVAPTTALLPPPFARLLAMANPPAVERGVVISK